MSKVLQNRGGHNFIRVLIDSMNLPAIILVNVIYVSCYVLWLYSKSLVHYFAQKLISGKVVVNHRLLDVTLFTELFIFIGMNGWKIILLLSLLFISKQILHPITVTRRPCKLSTRNNLFVYKN